MMTCFGPMSKEVIQALSLYAEIYKSTHMLIASRNQIECSDFGGGYVNNWTTEGYATVVRSYDPDKRLLLCRDHAGPYMHDGEKHMTYRETMDRVKHSIEVDVASGFDLIHIDTSRAPDPYAAAKELFEHTVKLNDKIKFEFGTEENVGVAASVETFRHDIAFAKQFCQPTFVVAQTGSLVKKVQQVGTFDDARVMQMAAIAESEGVLLKEHNADYISRRDVMKRKLAGVGATNVAPQLGVLQTVVTLQNASNIPELRTELNDFRMRVLKGDKWKKWEYGPDMTPQEKIWSSGHYYFMTPEYRALVEGIHTYIGSDVYMDILNEVMFNTFSVYHQ